MLGAFILFPRGAAPGPQKAANDSDTIGDETHGETFNHGREDMCSDIGDVVLKTAGLWGVMQW